MFCEHAKVIATIGGTAAPGVGGWRQQNESHTHKRARQDFQNLKFDIRDSFMTVTDDDADGFPFPLFSSTQDIRLTPVAVTRCLFAFSTLDPLIVSQFFASSGDYYTVVPEDP